MSQREKILAICVGTLLLIIVAYFSTRGISSAFVQRDNQIQDLERDIQKKKKAVQLGRLATKKIAQYERRSLPGDYELACSVYQRWLLESVERSEFHRINVKVVRSPRRGEVYQQLACSVNARGNLKQLTQWLHQFYSVGYLHRIRQLLVKPMTGTRDLDLNLTVEALSLVNAEKQKLLSDIPPGPLAEIDCQKYLDSILGRNLFGPPNQPPQIASSSTQRATINRSFSFRASASDADELDTLTYRLVENQLPGATIDSLMGRFSWTPKENGSFKLIIEVADDGYPSKTSRQTVNITVSDPLAVVVNPKSPAFDNSKFTWLTSIVEINGQPAIWLIVRTTGEKLVFREGDKFEIGSMQGIIDRIGTNNIEIKTGEHRLQVTIGDNLSQARELPEKDI